jgi:hypothetical protein
VLPPYTRPHQECKEQEAHDHLAAGYPTPVKAALPRNKEDYVDEKHARARNNRAFSLGRWVIRPAYEDPSRRSGGVVRNLDEVYLEQDQCFICEGGAASAGDGQQALREVREWLGASGVLAFLRARCGVAGWGAERNVCICVCVDHPQAAAVAAAVEGADAIAGAEDREARRVPRAHLRDGRAHGGHVLGGEAQRAAHAQGQE